MILTKREILTGTDGITELFSSAVTFNAGSLWVTKKLSTGETSMVSYTEFGTGFFQVSPAPEIGSELYITYDIEDESIDVALSAWDTNTLMNITNVLSEHSELLVTLKSVIDGSVTQSQFNKWAELMERKIAVIENSILLLS